MIKLLSLFMVKMVYRIIWTQQLSPIMLSNANSINHLLLMENNAFNVHQNCQFLIYQQKDVRIAQLESKVLKIINVNDENLNQNICIIIRYILLLFVQLQKQLIEILESSQIIQLQQGNKAHKMMIKIRGSDPISHQTQMNTKQPISCYEKLQVLGKGTYGIVFKSKHKKNGQIYAIKKIQKIVIAEQGVSRLFHREIAILKSLNHPNIIRMCEYNLIQSQKYGFLIFQYMESDLRKQIQKGMNGCYPKLGKTAIHNEQFKRTIKYIFQQILQGIQYCHSRNIFHRDLKPSNILVNHCLDSIKIADFGVAKKFDGIQSKYTQKIGTKYYRAPQAILNQRNYGPQIDIWGTALVICQCIIGQPLMKKFQNKQSNQLSALLNIMQICQFQLKYQSPHRNFDNLIQYIKNQNIKIMIEKTIPQIQLLGKFGIQLINKMLIIDPHQRISAADALKSPYFNSLYQ